MKGITAGMIIGGAIAGFLAAYAYNDFDMDDMLNKNARILKKTKRKLDRQMHAMGIL